MAKRKPSRRPRTPNVARLTSLLLTLAAGLSMHSCTHIPAGRDLAAASADLEALDKGLSIAVRRDAGTVAASPKPAPSSPPAARTGNAGESFSTCHHFFAGGKPPVVEYRPGQRALCYDAFAILHSGESRTAVYVAQKLHRALVLDADEKRTNRFFADARLPSGERATLADYKGSGLDKSHLAPADQMPTPAAMAQSFSLANIVPQAPPPQSGRLAGVS